MWKTTFKTAVVAFLLAYPCLLGASIINIKPYPPEYFRAKYMVPYIMKINPNVSEPTAKKIVASVEKYSKEQHVEPELVFAVMKTESTFNTKAKSKAKAVGLMQVHMPTHKEKFEGASPIDIDNNIKIGLEILADYMKRSASTFIALKRYNGSLHIDSDYAYNVLYVKRQLTKGIMNAV